MGAAAIALVELLCPFLFVGILGRTPNGRWLIDYPHFHDTDPVDDDTS